MKPNIGNVFKSLSSEFQQLYRQNKPLPNVALENIHHWKQLFKIMKAEIKLPTNYKQHASETKQLFQKINEFYFSKEFAEMQQLIKSQKQFLENLYEMFYLKNNSQDICEEYLEKVYIAPFTYSMQEKDMFYYYLEQILTLFIPYLIFKQIPGSSAFGRVISRNKITYQKDTFTQTNDYYNFLTINQISLLKGYVSHVQLKIKNIVENSKGSTNRVLANIVLKGQKYSLIVGFHQLFSDVNKQKFIQQLFKSQNLEKYFPELDEHSNFCMTTFPLKNHMDMILSKLHPIIKPRSLYDLLSYQSLHQKKKMPIYTIYLASKGYKSQMMKDLYMNVYLNMSNVEVQWICIKQFQTLENHAFNIKKLLNKGYTVGRLIQKKGQIVVIPIGRTFQWIILQQKDQNAILLNWKILPKYSSQLQKYLQSDQHTINYPLKVSKFRILLDFLQHEVKVPNQKNIIKNISSYLFNQLIKEQVGCKKTIDFLNKKRNEKIYEYNLTEENLAELEKFCCSCMQPFINYYVNYDNKKVLCFKCVLKELQIENMKICYMYDLKSIQCPLVKSYLFDISKVTSKYIQNDYQKKMCYGSFQGQVWFNQCSRTYKSQLPMKIFNHPSYGIDYQYNLLLNFAKCCTVDYTKKIIELAKKVPENDEQRTIKIQQIRRCILLNQHIDKKTLSEQLSKVYIYENLVLTAMNMVKQMNNT